MVNVRSSSSHGSNPSSSYGIRLVRRMSLIIVRLKVLHHTVPEWRSSTRLLPRCGSAASLTSLTFQ